MDTLIHIIIQWLSRVSGMDHLTRMKTKRKPPGGWKGRCRPS